MFQSLDVFKTAMAMARHAGQMQAVTAQNIANADTPKYRAKELPEFQQTLRKAQIAQRKTRPMHLNGSSGLELTAQDRRSAVDPNGNTVSLEQEMVQAVNAKRQHDRALAIYRNSLTILRAALNTR